MNYEDQLRQMFRRYPADDAKIFIDPEVCNLEKGFIQDFTTNMIEVDNPDDATCIPIWIGYADHISDEVMNKYVIPYPNKCAHVVNLIQQLDYENPDCDKETLEQIKELLAANDWESIYLGLNMMRTFNMTDEMVNIAKSVIDTVRSDRMANTASLIPLVTMDTINVEPESRRISIGDISLIKYYNLLLHNKFFE